MVFRGHRVIPYFVTLFLFLPVCFQGHKAFGTLTPNHIVIVVNRNNPGSRSVAQHYATRRGVPQDPILPLDLPHNETISRPDYQELLVHPLQELLKARKLASKTRVLVTTYGVPLRVQDPTPSREEAEWKKDAEAWQRAAQKFLEDLNLEINQVMDQPIQGGNPLLHTEKRRLSGGTPYSPEALLRTIAASVKSAQVRIRNIKDPHRRKEKEQRLSKVILKISGTLALAKVPFLNLGYPRVGGSKHFSPQVRGPNSIKFDNPTYGDAIDSESRPRLSIGAAGFWDHRRVGLSHEGGENLYLQGGRCQCG